MLGPAAFALIVWGAIALVLLVFLYLVLAVGTDAATPDPSSE